MLTIVRVAALAALLAFPCTARAEQAPPAAQPEQAAMPCPHAGKDGCCDGAGGCPGMQGQAAAGAAGQAAGDAGGCPCQKAAAAKAKAAAAAKPGAQ